MPDTTSRVDTGVRSGAGTSDRVAVVTGAAGGIGAAVTELLLRNGSRVLALDRQKPRTDSADRCLPAAVDIRVPGELSGVRQALLNRWSAPDLVVVSAGTYRPDNVTTDPVDWDELFDVGGRGVVETMRVFLPDLLDAAGAGKPADLMVIGAITAQADDADSTIFAATAAAITRFMAGLRRRFGERGLRVAHVAPGYVGEASMPDGEPTGLLPQDFADLIGYALDQPADVSIGEMVLVPTVP